MTSSSQFWENYGGINNAGGAVYGLKVNRDETIMKAAHLMKEKGSAKTKRLVRALLGAATGGAALEQFYETPTMTQFDPNTVAGKMVAVQRTVINRTTTAADLTMLRKATDTRFLPVMTGNGATTAQPSDKGYPTDRSGNGYANAQTYAAGTSKAGIF